LPEETLLSQSPAGSTSTAPARPLAVTVGVDVGGTKTHVAVLDTDGGRHDRIVPSSLWRSGALFDDDENFDRLISVILDVAAVDERTALVFGMHGCDNAAQWAAATSAISSRVAGRVSALNDAALLGPASGTDRCIQLIVGTGAVILGETADGDHISVEGYGWLLGDYGSAPALVRDAMRLLVQRADRTVQGDPLDDPFARALAEVYGAADVTELALAFTVGASATTWGAHAELLFACAEQGSAIARDTIDSAAVTIADGIAAVVRRGAVGSTVVAAGGVIVNQPLLQTRLRAELARVAPELELFVLAAPPVDGALALAARLHA
jgi:N-acetylglucosamine kinase-like BadF-type ATPase